MPADENFLPVEDFIEVDGEEEVHEELTIAEIVELLHSEVAKDSNGSDNDEVEEVEGAVTRQDAIRYAELLEKISSVVS